MKTYIHVCLFLGCPGHRLGLVTLCVAKHVFGGDLSHVSFCSLRTRQRMDDEVVVIAGSRRGAGGSFHVWFVRTIKREVLRGSLGASFLLL